MKNISKILCIALMAILTLAMFSGCGKKDEQPADTQDNAVVQDDSANTSESSIPEPTTSSSQTLEEFLKANPATMEQVKNSGDEHMKIEVKENNLIYVYDVSTMDGMTKDIALSNDMKEKLDSALESYSSSFSGLCDMLESATEIKGIKILVKYTYGDTVISEKEFEAN